MDEEVETVTLTRDNLKEVASKTSYSVRELALMERRAREENRTVVVLIKPLSLFIRDNDAYQGRHRE